MTDKTSTLLNYKALMSPDFNLLWNLDMKTTIPTVDTWKNSPK